MAEEYFGSNLQGSQGNEPRPETEFIHKENNFLTSVKNFLVFLILAGVVVASFWISFQLGKRVLFPTKKIPERIEVAIPEPPPSIKALQKLREVMSAEVSSAEAKKEEKKVAVAPKKVKQKAAAAKAVKTGKGYYKVQAGLFAQKAKAQTLANQVKAKGFDVCLKKVGSGWRVQVGAFKTKSAAAKLSGTLSSKGFKAQILYE